MTYTLLYYPHNIDELLELGVGDPRWSGSTPLIGAVVSGQPSIVQFLVDRGATLDAKTALGWTALDVAEGVFFANAKKEFPQAAAIIRKAMAGQAVPAAAAAPEPAQVTSVTSVDATTLRPYSRWAAPSRPDRTTPPPSCAVRGPASQRCTGERPTSSMSSMAPATFVTGGRSSARRKPRC